MISIRSKKSKACVLFTGLLGLSVIGCGGSTDVAGFPFPFPGNPTSSATPTTFEFLAVPNSGATPGSVSVRQIDLATGNTAELPGSPVNVAPGFNQDDPTMVVFSPDQRFAYVPNANTNLISAFTLDRDNSRLVPVPGSPFASGVQPTCSVAVHPNGRFLFCGGGDKVTSFSIADNGALTAVPDSSRSIGSKGFIAPNPCLMANGGQFLYVPGGDDGIYGFSVNASNGLLTQIALGRQGGTVEAIALHPNGQVLCAPVRNIPVTMKEEILPVVETTTVVRSLRIEADGKLTKLADRTIPFTPCGVSFSQAARLYVGSRGGNSVFGFEVNGSTGAITVINQGVGFPGGAIDTCFPVVDPSDKFVYASAQGDNKVFGYRIEDNGYLTALAGSPFSNFIGPAVPAVVRFTR